MTPLRYYLRNKSLSDINSNEMQEMQSALLAARIEIDYLKKTIQKMQERKCEPHTTKMFEHQSKNSFEPQTTKSGEPLTTDKEEL